jgi:hypothetical protein
VPVCQTEHLTDEDDNLKSAVHFRPPCLLRQPCRVSAREHALLLAHRQRHLSIRLTCRDCGAAARGSRRDSAVTPRRFPGQANLPAASSGRAWSCSCCRVLQGQHSPAGRSYSSLQGSGIHQDFTRRLQQLAGRAAKAVTRVLFDSTFESAGTFPCSTIWCPRRCCGTAAGVLLCRSSLS